jgi:hypothetical protein
MDNAAVVTATVTIAIAFIGFAATYINNLRLNQRQARLHRINRQLGELYGPLLAIRGASKEAWDYFIAKYGFRDHHISRGVPSEEDSQHGASGSGLSLCRGIGASMS